MRSGRGFFGWTFLLLFLAFQALMIGAAVVSFGAVADSASGCLGDAACEAGTVIGGGIFAAMGWAVWILGTLVLGFLVLMTRGRRAA